MALFMRVALSPRRFAVSCASAAASTMSADPSGCVGSQTPLAWSNGSLPRFGPELVDNGCQTMTGVTKTGPKLGVGEVRKTAKARDINADFDSSQRVIPIRARNYTYPIPGAAASAPVDTNEVNKMAHMLEAAIDKTALSKKKTDKKEKSPTKSGEAQKDDKAMKEPTKKDKKTAKKSDEAVEPLDKAKNKEQKETVKKDKHLGESAKKGKEPEESASKKKEAKEPAARDKAPEESPKKDNEPKELPEKDTPKKVEASKPAPASQVPKNDIENEDVSALDILLKAQASQEEPASVAVTEPAEPAGKEETGRPVEDDDSDSSSSSGGVDDYKFTIPDFGVDGDSPRDADMPDAEEMSEIAPTEIVEYPQPAEPSKEPAKKVDEKPSVKVAEEASAKASKAVVAAKRGSQWIFNDSSSDSSDSSEEFVFESAEAVHALAEPEAEEQPEEPKKQAEEEPPAKRVRKSPKKAKQKAADEEMEVVEKQPNATTPKKVVEDAKASSSGKRRSSVATKVPDSSAKKTDDAASDSSEDFGMVVPELKGMGEKEQPDTTPKRKVRPVKTAGRPKPSAPAKPTEPVSEESDEDKAKEVGGSPAPSGRSSRRSLSNPKVGTVVSVETGSLEGHNAETLFEALQKSINVTGGDKSQLVELLWPKNSTFAFLNTRVPKSRRSFTWLKDGKVKIDDTVLPVTKVTEKELKQKVSQEMKHARGDSTVHAGWAPEASAEESVKKPIKPAKRKRESTASAEKQPAAAPPRRDEKLYSEAVNVLRSSKGPVAKGSFMHTAIANLLDKKVPDAKECEFELSQGEGDADPQVTVKRADGSSEVWTASRVAEKKNSRVNSKRRKSRDGKKQAAAEAGDA